MSDLIDRQAAIDAVDEYTTWLWENFHQTVMGLTDVIRNVPSAEQKTGKWIEHNPHRYGLGIVFECSECGDEVDGEESNFCPNCGADMRGKHNDTMKDFTPFTITKDGKLAVKKELEGILRGEECPCTDCKHRVDGKCTAEGRVDGKCTAEGEHE